MSPHPDFRQLSRCVSRFSISSLSQETAFSFKYSIFEQKTHKKYNNDRKWPIYSMWAGFTFVGAAIGVGFLQKLMVKNALCEEKAQPSELTIPKRPDLPTFRAKDIAEHGQNSPRIWITYQNGVYDVTDFVEFHPGGDKILLAAGESLEPFWALYAQHNTEEVMEILEELRIGNLDPKDQLDLEQIDLNDPFSTDPRRHPALVINSQKPFNAETPASLLIDNFITPNELFFVRNHLPVPLTDESKHCLTVEGLGVARPLVLTVDELKTKFKPTKVTATIQCAGNRRAEMSKFKNVKGLTWTGTTISNAQWTGVPLKDILAAAGVDADDVRIKHVHFEGADVDPTGNAYGASIPIHKAFSSEVLVAYAMNDRPLPKDHGFPLRMIVPGVVGARQVKWLTTIRTSNVESPSHWQQKDYRMFSSSVNFGDKIDYDSAPAIQEPPVQSAICVPANGTVIDDAQTIQVSGYAWSGGGRGIIRVEVSSDGGENWHCAQMQQQQQQQQHDDQTWDSMWSWTLWTVEVPLMKGAEKHQLICKATDRAYNCQPELPNGIWNVRGLLNNSWHRVTVHIK